jgi:GrpB-like predicted nucleotidyltransferase (UPF0157 family)
MRESVMLVPHDPGWPRRFARERAVLDQVFAGCGAVIEHIGSTAVPGLTAKPVIDIMLGVAHLAEAESRISALDAVGYQYVQKYEAQLPDRRYFRKPRVGPRAFHLHCLVRGRREWVRHLAFRDHLRAHPDCAAAYDALKRELASRLDKDAYTAAKAPFIERVIATALASARAGRPADG